MSGRVVRMSLSPAAERILSEVREDDREHAKAIVESLPDLLGQHWYEKIDRVDGIHPETLRRILGAIGAMWGA